MEGDEVGRRRPTAIEALEAYSATHPETIEELMTWPWRRFLAAYEAFQRRQACDEMRAMKMAHLGGLAGNTNLDGEKVDRKQITQEIAESYEKAITQIWNGYDEEELEDDDDQID